MNGALASRTPHVSVMKRYAIARFLFHCRFGRPIAWPDGGLSSCDMRPARNFYNHNAYVTILPAASKELSYSLAVRRLNQMCRFLRLIRWFFESEDAVQVFVGFPVNLKPSCCRIFRGWIPASRLKDVTRSFTWEQIPSLGGAVREESGWSSGVFDDTGTTPPVQSMPPFRASEM
jgi:hypothetical protein